MRENDQGERGGSLRISERGQAGSPNPGREGHLRIC